MCPLIVASAYYSVFFKVNSARDVHFVAGMIDAVRRSQEKPIRILAAIESAEAIINLKEIASADPRIDALIFASEDFCADMELTRTGRYLSRILGLEMWTCVNGHSRLGCTFHAMCVCVLFVLEYLSFFAIYSFRYDSACPM